MFLGCWKAWKACVTGYLILCNWLHAWKKCFFSFFIILWHVGTMTHCVCFLVCFCRFDSWCDVEQYSDMVQKLEHEDKYLTLFHNTLIQEYKRINKVKYKFKVFLTDGFWNEELGFYILSWTHFSFTKLSDVRL